MFLHKLGELRGQDLNLQPLTYEASELPLLYPAVVAEGICIGTAT